MQFNPCKQNHSQHVNCECCHRYLTFGLAFYHFILLISYIYLTAISTVATSFLIICHFDSLRHFSAKYLATFEDQMYLNHVVAKDLPGRVDTLPRHHFPNGAFRAGPHFNATRARMIHFNYNIGHTKAAQMAEAGLWFVDATTGDTRTEYR